MSDFLSPPILFFFLGMLAVAVKSDLEIPQPLPRLFSLYLLMAIGFKGGVEIAHSGMNSSVVLTLATCILLSFIIPLIAYPILRVKIDVANAAALAATYGSISAVTFITALSFLEHANVPYNGYMVAAMALMESPAIIVGTLIARMKQSHATETNENPIKSLIAEAFTNSSVFLILGALLIGIITGEKGGEMLKPFTTDIFRGMLSFFLLDMGLVAAKRIGALKKAGAFLIAFGVLSPLLWASLALGCVSLLNLQAGDGLLLMVLAASASYIAVPAAIRTAIPNANPGLYVPMALAITFPFNIIIGIPLYFNILNIFIK